MSRKRHQPLFNAYYAKNNMSDSEIVRDLLGDNPRGKAAVRMSAEIRQLREHQRDHEAKRMLLMAECEELCVQFCDFVQFVLEWEALAAGYHYHRGEWRKKRFAKQDRTESDDRLTAATKPADTPKRSPVKRPPARRSMPKRPPLDYRCPLVRGIGCRRRSIPRPKATSDHVLSWYRHLTARRQSANSLMHAFTARHVDGNRASELGKCQQPRPPPAKHVGWGKFQW